MSKGFKNTELEKYVPYRIRQYLPSLGILLKKIQWEQFEEVTISDVTMLRNIMDELEKLCEHCESLRKANEK